MTATKSAKPATERANSTASVAMTFTNYPASPASLAQNSLGWLNQLTTKLSVVLKSVEMALTWASINAMMETLSMEMAVIQAVSLKKNSDSTVMEART